VLAGLVLCGVVWWVSTVVHGDALFHLARVRKLEEVPVLYSVRVADEFRDGSLHPGYAFPVWEGALALVARLAGVDAGLVVQHLGAILVPLALVLAYAAGTALFASSAGGVATAVGQAAVVAFPAGGIGAFERLALPEGAARLLLVPALLALVFAYVRGGSRVELVTVGVAGLALAVVQPSYAALVCIPLAGFALARLALSREGRADARRVAAAIGVVLVPVAAIAAWLATVLAETNAFFTSREEEARAVVRSAGQLDPAGSFFGLDPAVVARGGAGAIAGLLAVVVAPPAARRRWGAFVLGGSLAGLAVLLVPPLFTTLSDLVTLPQARRLAVLLPFPFAIAGLAVVVGRLRLAGCAAAAALAVGLGLAFSARAATGPEWATWSAVAVAVIGLAAGRRVAAVAPAQRSWAVAVAIAFAIPLAVLGLADAQRDRPDPHALTPGLVHALRTVVPVRAVVFADLDTSYRLAAEAPLSIVAAPPAHVARTERNRPYDRRRDVASFFWHDGLSYLDRAGILSKYGATWLLVDKARRYPAYVRLLPAKVYEDDRYALFRLRR
jgi:hypothetical protein